MVVRCIKHSFQQLSVTVLAIDHNLGMNIETGFEDLVNKAVEGIFDILAGLRACLESVHIIIMSELL